MNGFHVGLWLDYDEVNEIRQIRHRDEGSLGLRNIRDHHEVVV